MALTSVYVDISALEVRLKKFKLDRTGNDDTIQLGINARGIISSLEKQKKPHFLHPHQQK